MSASPNPHIFRAYDVRGIASGPEGTVDLTPEFAHSLGRAFGATIKEGGGSKVCLGRDCRIHSDALAESFAKGLLEAGLDIEDVGVVASPMLYWAVHRLGADGGVMVTGSHNPKEYNGFKMMRGKDSFWGDDVQKLRKRIVADDLPEAEAPGTRSEQDILAKYIKDIDKRVRLGDRPLKVVIDAGHGVGGPPAVALLRALRVDAVELYTEMDGTFPAHHPDPTVAENLMDLVMAVRRERADLGIAYDGDADRIGVVDEEGNILWGDKLLTLLARDLLRKVPGATIVGEVKCSQTLFDDIEAQGGVAIMSAVGHSVIKARMKEENAHLAGEMSGHIFFKHRWYGFDDALYTTARLLEIVSNSHQPVSRMLSDLPKTHVTPELRLDCPDDKKFVLVEAAAAKFAAKYPVIDIDGARIDFGDGWGLIRASNTQPVVVLRAEANSPERLATIRATLEGFVAGFEG